MPLTSARHDRGTLQYRRVMVFSWLVLAASTGMTALAHDDPSHEKPRAVDEAVLYQPTAMPDRLMLSWHADPAHSQAVTWRTNTSVKNAFAELAVATSGPTFVAKAVTIPAKTSLYNSDIGPIHYHTARFEDLQPNTLYVYRVGDGVNFSAWCHFRTTSVEPRPFTFVYFGDAQNDIKMHWSRVFREAFTDAPRALFMLHAGDLVNRGNREAEWAEWCDAGGWVNASMPTVAVTGNHEYDIERTGTLPTDPVELKKLPRGFTRLWRHRFEFPDNGPPEMADHLRETVFYFDVQGVRVIGLNSMENPEPQARWLETVLKNNPNRWTVISHHHPVYSATLGRDNPEIRHSWQPLYDKYRVDLVLQGHDHAYLRTELRSHENIPTGATARSPAGTMYVVSVSGPKLYEKGISAGVRRGSRMQLYQVISVDGDELRYQAKTVTGELYDAFTLKKRDGDVNELVEQVPNTPEYVAEPVPEE
ncbi:purple acid phosphatase family protein [Schlesneria paludicola]|uniref:purple acid phosphatase family protein n=1 Tax=Schlesneria paludicola TaxID=360056 RepID=UPI00029A15D0|nr:metallophosphoesterase family protein [Schlesneria paludicola]